MAEESNPACLRMDRNKDELCRDHEKETDGILRRQNPDKENLQNLPKVLQEGQRNRAFTNLTNNSHHGQAVPEDVRLMAEESTPACLRMDQEKDELCRDQEKETDCILRRQNPDKENLLHVPKVLQEGQRKRAFTNLTNNCHHGQATDLQSPTTQVRSYQHRDMNTQQACAKDASVSCDPKSPAVVRPWQSLKHKSGYRPAASYRDHKSMEASGMQRRGLANAKHPTYKYVESVRKKNRREELQATECQQCKKFYDVVLAKNANGVTASRCEHHDASRHRHRHAPPATPEDFWNLGFDSDL